jgi:hypothetical protein
LLKSFGTSLLCNITVLKNIFKSKKLKAMKRQTISLFTQLDKEDLAALTTIVKESLDVYFVPTTEKVFSQADLWNIHRMKRPFVQRRGIF